MKLRKLVAGAAHFLGVERQRVSHRERLVSALGGLVGILAAFLASRNFAGDGTATLITASVGASAVLLFAVPHGTLSQPWPVLGGHLISAAIGVTCAGIFWNPLVAAPLAVAMAIAAMHYLRCIHPPGGATALIAVIGGPAVRELGYGFIVTPVFVNILALLAAAVVFNSFFPRRRYPASLARIESRTAPPAAEPYGPIAHEDFVYALSQIDSLIDVSEEDLVQIYELATRRSRATAARA